MKIDSDKFRVRPGEEMKLRNRPTRIRSFYKTKKKYSAMLHQLNPSLYLGMQVVFLIVAIQFVWEIYQLFLESRRAARQ